MEIRKVHRLDILKSREENLLVNAVVKSDPALFDALAKNSLNWTDEIEGIGNFLHITVYLANKEMLEHLLKSYYSKYMVHLIKMRNQQGKTPLILATNLQFNSGITLLLT